MSGNKTERSDDDYLPDSEPDRDDDDYDDEEEHHFVVSENDSGTRKTITSILTLSNIC
jgi:hypothetical protein